MTQKERYRLFIEYFQQTRPVAETELEYSSPYELLVAVILVITSYSIHYTKLYDCVYGQQPAELVVAPEQLQFPHLHSVPPIQWPGSGFPTVFPAPYYRGGRWPP